MTNIRAFLLWLALLFCVAGGLVLIAPLFYLISLRLDHRGPVTEGLLLIDAFIMFAVVASIFGAVLLVAAFPISSCLRRRAAPTPTPTEPAQGFEAVLPR